MSRRGASPRPSCGWCGRGNRRRPKLTTEGDMEWLTRNRIWSGLEVAVGLVGLIGLALALLRPGEPHLAFTEAKCGLIVKGMPRREVEGLLGGPPGDYATRPTYAAPRFGSIETLFAPEWKDDAGNIVIRF